MKNDQTISIVYESSKVDDEQNKIRLEQAYDLLFELMENEYGNDTAE